MAIMYKRLVACLVGIGAIGFHAASFAVVSKHPVIHKKKKVTNVQAETTPIPPPITMPVSAMPKPKSVSVYDPKQIYVPRPILPPVKIDGNIRVYDFDRHFYRSGVNDRTAFSAGGKLNLLSDLFLQHFRWGGTVYTAQPLGFNTSNIAKQDRSLPAVPITPVGQAFIQLETPHLFGRVGNQLITTPWMNPADSRMIPATYQALYGVLAPWQSLNTPEKNLNFVLFRQIRFKSRTSENFTQTNLYNTANLTSASIAALGNHPDVGTFAGGALFKWNKLNIQAWGYQFFNYAKIFYADFKYTFALNSFIRPIIGAQVLNNPADGGDIIANQGLGSVKSSGYGVLIGAEIADGQILLAWNRVPTRDGGYRNGDIVSPYTSGYAADPLYTTSMTAGLIEKAAGTAGKLTGSYAFFDHQLVLAASGARYYTQPFLTNSSEIDLDAIYTPVPFFKRSFSARGRVGFMNHTASGKETYSRLMLEYDFA